MWHLSTGRPTGATSSGEHASRCGSPFSYANTSGGQCHVLFFVEDRALKALSVMAPAFPCLGVEPTLLSTFMDKSFRKVSPCEVGLLIPARVHRASREFGCG